jgi:hypothetical protein
MYDGEGNRWLRRVSSDGGRPLLTLRDATGQVAAEYEQRSPTSELQVKKHYIRGNGRLLSVLSTCGPAPELNVFSISDTSIVLSRKDFAPPVDDFTIRIEADGGGTTYQTLPKDNPGQFSLFTVGWSSDTDYWISIEAELSCGKTGYGNAVSWISKSSAENCIRDIAVGNGYFWDSWRTIRVVGAGTCPIDDPDLRYAVLYYPESGGYTWLATNLPQPDYSIYNSPYGAGHGRYSIQSYYTGTYPPLPLPMALNDEKNSSGDAGERPGTPTWRRAEYIHWDHLGSTRMVTDEQGQEIAHYKY